MFDPTRDEARQFFFTAWRKHLHGEPVTPMENRAIEVVLAHPEYQRVLGDPERYLTRDYAPELGETNPFLHLALHVAIAEQLAIDQPPGIVDQYKRLLARHDFHEAAHEIMECLAETIWQAQRTGQPPDATAYLECLKKRG